MDYEEWRVALFEDTFPKASLSHGEIVYHAAGNDRDYLEIFWGNRRINLDLNDFYNGETISPLMEIKNWAYANLPFIQDELDETYVAYNCFSKGYDAYTTRPLGHVVVSRNVNPLEYSNYGNAEIIRRKIISEMDGTVLCLYTKERKIPSALSISHKESFIEIVSEFVDYDDNLTILLPDSITANHVFTGHRDSIMRLAETFTEGSTTVMRAGEWFEQIDLQNKGKHV